VGLVTFGEFSFKASQHASRALQRRLHCPQKPLREPLGDVHPDGRLYTFTSVGIRRLADAAQTVEPSVLKTLALRGLILLPWAHSPLAEQLAAFVL
jgi:hypothetical protein